MLASGFKANPRYKTLFYGLKKNHPRNVAVVYPMMFLLRRVIYVIVILFLTQVPFLAIIILMLTCLVMLSFVFTEAQWEDSIINQQHVINEIAFYLILLHVVSFVGLDPTPATTIILGWSLISTLLLNIAYNIGVLIYLSLRYFKMTFKHWWYRRHLILAAINQLLRRGQANKVASIRSHVSIDIQPLKYGGETTERGVDLDEGNIPIRISDESIKVEQQNQNFGHRLSTDNYMRENDEENIIVSTKPKEKIHD